MPLCKRVYSHDSWQYVCNWACGHAKWSNNHFNNRVQEHTMRREIWNGVGDRMGRWPLNSMPLIACYLYTCAHFMHITLYCAKRAALEHVPLRLLVLHTFAFYVHTRCTYRAPFYILAPYKSARKNTHDITLRPYSSRTARVHNMYFNGNCICELYK
jgi:hypothetical protein